MTKFQAPYILCKVKRLRIIFFGEVQGVGFRYAAHDVATKFGVKGWVKNLPDGRVEVVSEGREAALQAYLEEIKKAMANFIRETSVNWEPATEEFTRFEIRY